MSDRWKRIGVAVTLAALVTVFGVVSGFATANDSAKKAETLKIMGFGPSDEIANTRAQLAERALGGANVDNPRGGFNDQRFLAAVASRDVPDVVYLGRDKVGTYAAKGAFVPLASCIKGQKINLKQFRKAALSEVTYKGKLYAIPEFTNQRTVIVNNTVVRSAGLKVADLNTANWTKLAQANRKMVRRSGDKVSRIGFDPKLPEFFPLWAKANGHDILSKNGLKAQLDHPKAIAALQFAYSLIQAHGGWGPFKAFRDTHDFFGAKNGIAENQLGATPIENFYFAVLARVSPNVNITAVSFKKRNGAPITWITGNGWAIPKGAKNPGLACTWIRIMTRWQSWVAAARARIEALNRQGRPFTGLYTGNSIADVKIYEDLYQKTRKKSFDDAVRLLVQVQKYSFTIPASPAGSEFQQAWQDAVNRVLNRQQTPAQALRQAQREAQAAIDRAK